MNLENTKVYTKDLDVIRKYAELCGKKVPCLPCYECIGIAMWSGSRFFDFFIAESLVDTGGEEKEITPEQINALYAEKFGSSSEAPNGSEWKSGDNGRFGKNMRGGVYAAWDQYNNGHAVYCAGDYFYVMSHELFKPETEADRKERERLEAIKKLINNSELPNSSNEKISAILTMTEDVYGSGALFAVADLLENYNG